MADGERARQRSALGMLPRAESTNLEESLRPFTSFVTATISHSTQSQDLTLETKPTKPVPVSLNSSIEPSTGPSFLTPSSSSHIWHPTRVGTVVSESEIPAAWGAKDLEVEAARTKTFLGCIALIFVLFLMVIIGAGCWK